DETALSNPQELVARIEKLPHIKAAAATLYVRALLSGSNQSVPAVLKAVDFSYRPEADEVCQTIVSGSGQDLRSKDSGGCGIILGGELANSTGLKIGDAVTAISSPNEGRLTPVGLAPRQKVFTVVSIFESGLFDYDSNWAYTSMDAARQLLSETEVAEVI